MNKCLAGISGVDAYIDNIVIYSVTWEEHIETIERVFQRFKFSKLVINLSKSNFSKAEVKYLGHIIGYGKITQAKTCDTSFCPTMCKIVGQTGFSTFGWPTGLRERETEFKS